MVFKRRDRRSWFAILRHSVYPRTGWRRAVEYIGHRLKRLPDTPHKIALGFACGVFVSFSPLFGLHFIYAGICAAIIRGNILAAFLGTFVGNPLTFPLIATVSLQFGLWLTGEYQPGAMEHLLSVMWDGVTGVWNTLKSFFGMGMPEWDVLNVFFRDVFWTYLLGGILPGLVAGVITYVIGLPLVRTYQSRRRERRLKKMRARRVKMRQNPAE